MSPRLSYNLFVHITPSHESHGYWRHPNGRHMVADYKKLDPWVDLAKSLERGCFDTMFIGDTLGPYETYKSSADPCIRGGMQFPGSDPSVLVSAMAYATKHLGFVVTSSILQAHPFEFARRMSTLDHLTDGRVGWNIVTSYLDSTARNLGLNALPEKSQRYRMAAEYVDVVYKLWEASWDDRALVADAASGVLFEPSLIRAIDHVGQYYRSAGPHLVEPSPQRSPMLFQAGSSPDGQVFAANNAEVTFLAPFEPAVGAKQIADLRSRMAAAGRDPYDIVPIVLFAPMIGSTEQEALQRQKELHELADYDAIMALWCDRLELPDIDENLPIGAILADPAAHGFAPDSRGGEIIKIILGKAPDKSIRFRDFVVNQLYPSGRFAGTPEQIADEITRWADVGAGGFNIIPITTLGWIDEWVDHVVPVLQKRGLQQKQYEPGTLRNKFFGRGPYLPDSHPARQRRVAA